MEIQEIQEKWNYRERDLGASVELWDSMAGQFSEYEIPTPQNSSLLRLIAEKKMIDSDSTILDVGCGTGKYSFSLAKESKHVTGVDLSPKMIEKAQEKKKETNTHNVHFQVADWHATELETLGFSKAFDLVIANMTPAVRNFDTFIKLSKAGKGFCIMSKPIKRTDPVSDAVRQMLGIEKKKESSDTEFLYAFQILWQQGFLPELHYEDQVWDMKKPLDDAYKLYGNRMKSYRELTKEEEKRIYTFLESISEDGFVMEKVMTTIATMMWNVDRQQKM